MKDYCLFYNSPIGYLKLTSNEFSLKSIRFVDATEFLNSSSPPEILKKAEIQLQEYFEGKRFSFNLDLDPEGTTFQKQVWGLVQTVDFGKTRSYNDIAGEIGSSAFCRAVGLANGKNPLPIGIPIHTINCSKGKFVRFSCGL